MPPWGIGKYRSFNYLSDFAENWLKGVYTCVRMTPVKSFLNQTNHSKLMIKNLNAPYISYHLMRHIRFRVKILAAYDAGIWLRNTMDMGVVPPVCIRYPSVYLISIQWENNVQWNSDNSKTCLTQTKFHGLCLANNNLLGISQTFSHNLNWQLQLVPSNYLLCGGMCQHSCVTSLISLFSFHMRQKSHFRKFKNFRKFSQEMEYTRAKWTCYGGNVVKAKGQHNS